MIFLFGAAFRTGSVVGFGKARISDEENTLYIINVYLFGVPNPITVTYDDEETWDKDYDHLVTVFSSVEAYE